MLYEQSLRARLIATTYMPTRIQQPRVSRRFTDFAAEWLNSYVRANNRPSEQQHKRIVFRAHLLPAFGRFRLDEVGEPEIERFKAVQLRNGLAAKTVNLHVGMLLKCLGTAKDWGYLEVVPKSQKVTQQEPPTGCLTDADAARLLAASKEPLADAMVLVALRIGLRLGELRGLRWESVDFARGQLTVRASLVKGFFEAPKNGRTRAVPLAADARGALAGIRRAAGFVFAHALPGGTMAPVSANTAARWLADRCGKAGLSPIGWHALRHTFASQLVARNVPLPAVKELLGHSTIQMTMRYTHSAPAALREAVDALRLPPAPARLDACGGNRLNSLRKAPRPRGRRPEASAPAGPPARAEPPGGGRAVRGDFSVPFTGAAGPCDPGASGRTGASPGKVHLARSFFR